MMLCHAILPFPALQTKCLPNHAVREAILIYVDQNFRGFTRTEGPIVLLRYRERM